jgi:hypothetical protein
MSRRGCAARMERPPQEERAPSPGAFELEYSPNLGMATHVSRCLLTFCERFVCDPGVLSRLRVAIQELLENTALQGGDHVVTIQTTNRANDGDIARLKTALEEIAHAEDAHAHYQVLMKRVVGEEHLPGLGLGSISAELGMSLRYEQDGDRVTVVATHAPRPVESRAGLDFPAVSAANFAADATSADGVLTLSMSGVADEHSRDVVGAVIARMHNEAVRTQVAQVVLDLRELEFMSSSCIKFLVSWVAMLQEADEGNRYSRALPPRPGRALADAQPRTTAPAGRRYREPRHLRCTRALVSSSCSRSSRAR